MNNKNGAEDSRAFGHEQWHLVYWITNVYYEGTIL